MENRQYKSQIKEDYENNAFGKADRFVDNFGDYLIEFVDKVGDSAREFGFYFSRAFDAFNFDYSNPFKRKSLEREVKRKMLPKEGNRELDKKKSEDVGFPVYRLKKKD